MVAVYRSCHDANSTACRSALLSAGIPCFLIGHGLPHAAAAARVPFVIFPDTDMAVSDSFRRSLPPEKFLLSNEWFSPQTVTYGVKLCYFQRLGHDFELAAGGGIRFSDRSVYFCGHYLPLTDSEYLILRLLYHCRGFWFSADEIAASCFENGTGAVTGHVCSINRKARLIKDMPLIETRRIYGYRFR